MVKNEHWIKWNKKNRKWNNPTSLKRERELNHHKLGHTHYTHIGHGASYMNPPRICQTCGNPT